MAKEEKKSEEKKPTGYCVKCKEKGREMNDAQVVEMKNGRKATKGVCSVCGTGMYSILPKDK